MASTKDLKKRIGTVKNTQQTTKAMKMVSAAKLRRAQEAVLSQRPYAREVGSLINQVSAIAQGKIESPFFLNPAAELSTNRTVLVVAVTSDRGLCGGFNSSVIKTTQKWIDANKSKYARIECAFVGRRGNDFFKTKGINLVKYYSECGGKVTFAKAKVLADSLVERFTSGEVSEIKIIYNEFKNAATQQVVTETFLPLSPPVQSGAAEAGDLSATYVVKPDLNQVFESLLKKTFAAQTFRILLESQAGEHGARMSAMENATKNAGEMIKKLSLQYNKQRQAGITKELLEIIAGSESQKGA